MKTHATSAGCLQLHNVINVLQERALLSSGQRLHLLRRPGRTGTELGPQTAKKGTRPIFSQYGQNKLLNIKGFIFYGSLQFCEQQRVSLLLSSRCCTKTKEGDKLNDFHTVIFAEVFAKIVGKN